MNNGRIDADHEIKIHDERSRIGKVAAIGHPVNQLKGIGGRRSLFLKGKELHVRHIGQRSQYLRRHGSFLVRCDKIGRVGARSSRPDKTDFESTARKDRKSIPPAGEIVGIGVQIGNRRRYRFDGCLKGQRQMHHGTVKIERRNIVDMGHNLINAVQRLDEPLQWRRHQHDDIETARFDQRRIAAELQGIAESLLGVDQDRFPLAGFTLPLGLGKIPEGMSKLLRFPPPFILAPSFIKAPQGQQGHRKILVDIGIVRLKAQRLFISRNSFLMASGIPQCVAEVVEGARIIRTQSQGLPAIKDRTLDIAFESPNRTQIAQGFGKRRVIS